MAAAALLLVLVGSLVYCGLVVLAARRYLAARPPALRHASPISILKPLSGHDEGLEDNLRSYFAQDYPEFEIVLAVRQRTDAAVPVVEKLRQEYPGVAARLLVTGEPPYPNAKVFALVNMVAAARHDLLVMADSDTREQDRRMLAVLASEFQDERLGLATCPYRAVAGKSFWSRLEALGMNTEFLPGVLVARLIEGMKFGVGPTMAARRQAVETIGGFEGLKDYLAEDFVMGQRMAAAGFGVILSSYAIEHRIGSEPFARNLDHRLRWARSTRCSRPAGYVGQVFTNPLPLALLVVALKPAWWALLPLAFALRALAAWSVAGRVLHDPLTRARWWLVPLQDVASFLFWCAGFFGTTVIWRGRRYRLSRDGRLQRVMESEEKAVARPPR